MQEPNAAADHPAPMSRSGAPTPPRSGLPTTVAEWVILINDIRRAEGFESPPLFPPMDAPSLPLPSTDCAGCGYPLTDKQLRENRRRKQRRYCSQACYGLSKTATMAVICPCGATVDLPAWRARKGSNNAYPKYCDRACYEKLGRGKRRTA